jgi:hypothetical protein
MVFWYMILLSFCLMEDVLKVFYSTSKCFGKFLNSCDGRKSLWEYVYIAFSFKLLSES